MTPIPPYLRLRAVRGDLEVSNSSREAQAVSRRRTLTLNLPLYLILQVVWEDLEVSNSSREAQAVSRRRILTLNLPMQRHLNRGLGVP